MTSPSPSDQSFSTAVQDPRLELPHAESASVPGWVCPDHRSPLDTRDGELVCTEGHSFPVRDGIPRYVESGSYAAAFGPQWLQYRLTQLDSVMGVPLGRDRARRCLGEADWARLADSTVLECGCGAGRFTEVLLSEGALVTSIDLTEAVDANRMNFPLDERHRIAQADILKLPFAGRGFDIVFCLGVIQHTPNPEQTIAALFEHVRPGGLLVIDHYTYRLGYFLSPQPFVRAILRRLPPQAGLRVTNAMVRVLWPMHSKLRKHRKLLNRVSPVYTYFDLHPQLSDEHQRAWSYLDTHDALTDYYKWLRTPRQVRRALTALDADDIHVWRGGNGVEARARRSEPRRSD